MTAGRARQRHERKLGPGHERGRAAHRRLAWAPRAAPGRGWYFPPPVSPLPPKKYESYRLHDFEEEHKTVCVLAIEIRTPCSVPSSSFRIGIRTPSFNQTLCGFSFRDGCFATPRNNPAVNPAPQASSPTTTRSWRARWRCGGGRRRRTSTSRATAARPGARPPSAAGRRRGPSSDSSRTKIRKQRAPRRLKMFLGRALFLIVAPSPGTQVGTPR